MGRQLFSYCVITLFIVNSRYADVGFAIVVFNRKQLKVPHYFRRQKLTDKAFILKVMHGKVHGVEPVFPGDVREPVAVFFRWLLTDAFNIHKHIEPEGVGVNPTVIRAVIVGLGDHAGVAVQKLQHKAVGNQAFVIQCV